MRNEGFSLPTGVICCVVVGWSIVCRGVTVDEGGMWSRCMFSYRSGV